MKKLCNTQNRNTPEPTPKQEEIALYKYIHTVHNMFACFIDQLLYEKLAYI